MEAVLMILLFSFFAILSDRLESKKKKRQAEVPRREIPFEIPDIGKAAETKPAAPAADHKEIPAILDGYTEKYREYLEREATAPVREKTSDGQLEKTAGKGEESPINLQPGTILQAMAYKEIFDRPKAWSRIHRRR